MAADGFRAIFRSLELAACPGLRQLDLSSSHLGLQAAIALAKALTSSLGYSLQWLRLHQGFMDRSASLVFLQQIRGVPLPSLSDLDLGSTSLEGEHGRVLGECVGAGAFPVLGKLVLFSNYPLAEEGVVPIMAGL